MKQMRAILTAALSLACVRSGSSALLEPGSVSLQVGCGATIQVTDEITGLRLEPTDPLVTGACNKDGITIRNGGSGRVDRSFALDCDYLTISGRDTGVGITLKGPGLSAINCHVEHFKNGIVAGAGSSIEDSRVSDSTGDGVVVTSNVDDPASVTGTQSRSNRGWGFVVKGRGATVDAGTWFRSKATGNGKGGFSVRGDANTITSSDALGNHGPGFLVTGAENVLTGNDAEGNGDVGIKVMSSSCCKSNRLDTAIVSGNVGPGLLVTGRPNADDRRAPVGLDVTPGNIEADANGDCPAGALPEVFGRGVCLYTAGTACGVDELRTCGILPPPTPLCGNALVEPGEECDGISDAACPGECRTDCLCPNGQG